MNRSCVYRGGIGQIEDPKKGRDLPLGAISVLAFGWLNLQPVMAVFMTQGLARVGAINEENKVLRFVLM